MFRTKATSVAFVFGQMLAADLHLRTMDDYNSVVSRAMPAVTISGNLPMQVGA